MAARPASSSDDGFTLIELLVSLALFALISLAGIKLIETTVGVQQRTEGRSERLAELQRALYLISADFEQMTAGPQLSETVLSLERTSSEGDYPVDYYLAEGSLHRVASGNDRIVLERVSTVQWRFFKNGTWTSEPVSEEAPERPSSVEFVLELGRDGAFAGGSLRRVIELPAEP